MSDQATFLEPPATRSTDSLPVRVNADPEVDVEDDADDRNVERAFVAMHAEDLIV